MIPPANNVPFWNPLTEPYRTGSYLVYDMKPGCPDHFREVMSLQPNPYPASGGRQLDASQLKETLAGVVDRHATRHLFLVDLREETHGFIDGRAVSWYADNDFGNVGVPTSLIQKDEQARLAVLQGATTQLFTIQDDPSDNRAQQRMMPVTVEDLTAVTTTTEAAEFDNLKIRGCTVHYRRIAVTDHCKPTPARLNELYTAVPVSNDPAEAWVHFHCHGGDGRTTTFLALYDMMCWKKFSKDPFPDLTAFACRQFESLPPYYCLNPDGCNCRKRDSQPIAGWKRPLAEDRWKMLADFHDNPMGGFDR